MMYSQKSLKQLIQIVSQMDMEGLQLAETHICSASVDGVMATFWLVQPFWNGSLGPCLFVDEYLPFFAFFLKSASRFLNFFGGRFRDVSPLNSDFWGVDCLVDWNVRADETLFSVGLQLSWNMLSYWQQFQAPPFGFHKFEIVNASKSFWISKIRNLVVFFILKVEGQGLLLIWKAPPAIRMASPKIHPHEKLHGTMTSQKKHRQDSWMFSFQKMSCFGLFWESSINTRIQDDSVEKGAMTIHWILWWCACFSQEERKDDHPQQRSYLLFQGESPAVERQRHMTGSSLGNVMGKTVREFREVMN